MLKRSPKFLRVVDAASPALPGLDDGRHEFDALDQLEDTPAANEKIYVYVLDKHLGNCHINRGRNGGGFYPMCSYRFLVNQPDDFTMRNADAWKAYLQSQP